MNPEEISVNDDCERRVMDIIDKCWQFVESLGPQLKFDSTTSKQIAADGKLDTETKKFRVAQKAISDIEAQLEAYNTVLNTPEAREKLEGIAALLAGVLKGAKSDRNSLADCADSWLAVRSRLSVLYTRYRSEVGVLRTKRTPHKPEAWAAWARKQVSFAVIQLYLSVV